MASTRRSAATRSSICAASKTAVIATVAAAPLSACAATRTQLRVALLDRGRDRREMRRAILEKQFDHLGDQLPVAARPVDELAAVEHGGPALGAPPTLLRRRRTAASGRSASRGSRPCRPRGSARGRPSSRARSSRRSACGRPCRASRCADRRRRLEPAHLRHLHVHQHHVERSRARAPRAPPGRCRRRSTAWPRLREQADRDALIDDVVFGEQDLRAPDGGAAAGAARRAARRRRRRVRSQHAADRVEQLGLPDRLGQVRRDARARGSAPRRRTGPPRSAS